MGDDLLTVRRIVKTYDKGYRALNEVSFSIKQGECLGLVGESGSGKTTLARCLLLIEKTDEGEIWFQNIPLDERNTVAYRKISGRMQAVFQNPTTSLNPKLRVIDSLMEPLDRFKDKSPAFLGGSRGNRSKTAERLLEMVGLSVNVLHQYPHELSGGQKQRVSIARAISIAPAIIIMDEPTASLDVLIQAEILNLLKELQEGLGFSYLFISHDLAAVHFMSDRVLVMENGHLIDEYKREDLFSPERHSYTRHLLSIFEE
jgi:peptide/nickel transport system ATP-binding protein